jgi:ABC-3C protein
MKYAYEDLSDTQFEVLVIHVCQSLLGAGVQGFSTGADGGRDARFHGTAERHPSTTAPWTGIVIIQAKHTNGYNRLFSDSDFYSKHSSNTIIGKEVPRIRRLRTSRDLDHYMLFANRRLSAIADNDIRGHLATECDVPKQSIALCGVEQVEIWLKMFPEIVQRAGIDPVDSPLLVSPEELADVVEAIAAHEDFIAEVLDAPPVARVSYEHKNLVNGMSQTYAREQRKRYLKDTAQIRSFLSAPENVVLMRKYESVVEEFQLKIISKKKDYQSFDEVMEYLSGLLFARDSTLRAHKRLTRTMLFYMYWNCDIGLTEDAQAN